MPYLERLRVLRQKVGANSHQMKVREWRHGEIHVLHISGDIDMHHCGGLRERFNEKRDVRCRALVLDFSEVNFVDSTGIAVLIEYLRDATAFGGHFCITGLSEPVRQIFEIVRLDKALPIFVDLDEAKAALCSDCVPVPPEPLFGEQRQRVTSAPSRRAKRNGSMMGNDVCLPL